MTEPRHRAEGNPVTENVRAMMAERAIKADATQRGKRTLIQGLALDVALAIAAALLVWLPDADLSSREAWIILGTALGKTVLTAVASYVMRLKVAPDQP